MNIYVSQIICFAVSKSKNISTIMMFKGIPYDATNDRRNFEYQTKTEIYDKLCGKCGFKRITVKIGDEENPGESSEEEIVMTASRNA